MASETVERTAITIRAGDARAAQRVAEALLPVETGNGARSAATMVTAEGQTLELPGFLVTALHALVSLLARGDDVALVPVHRDLSIDEAAILLGVSPARLQELTETNDIPSTGSGAEARIRLADLVAYRERRSAQHRAYLAEALAIAQEAGAYD
jgi:excisionase family DNA binding protein